MVTVVNTAMAGNGIDTDTMFMLLSSERRRLLLGVLDEYGSMGLGEAAEHVAAQQEGKRVEQLSSAERKRVYISFYQVHIPKLREEDVVAGDSDCLRLTAAADRLLWYIRNGPDSISIGDVLFN